MTGGGWAERPLDGDDRDAEHLWILQQDEDEDEDDDDHVLQRPSDDDWI